MTPTALPSTLLPRARSLTEALVAPAGPSVAPAVVNDLGRSLRDLTEITHGCGTDAVRVNAFTLRTGGRPPHSSGPHADAPFRWTTRTARRAVGVAAAARVVGGSARSPSQGAELAVTALIEDCDCGRARPGSLARWLGSVPGGVMAAVLAEATSWATNLVTAVEWSRLEGHLEIGGPDRWWDVGGRPPVGLRGRADVRVTVAPAAGSGPTTGLPPPASEAFLTLLGGYPGPVSRAELGLAALVDVLRRPSGPAPARVVGWWPECGRALVLDVDEELLMRTAKAVLNAVDATLRRRRPQTQPRSIAVGQVAAPRASSRVHSSPPRERAGRR